jgi:hypothetical protein
VSCKALNDEPLVYPNPTAGDFTVAFNSATAGVGAIHVMNGNNAVLYSTSLSVTNGVNQVFISGVNLSSGIYFVNIEVNAENVVKKLVVR